MSRFGMTGTSSPPPPGINPSRSNGFSLFASIRPNLPLGNVPLVRPGSAYPKTTQKLPVVRTRLLTAWGLWPQFVPDALSKAAKNIAKLIGNRFLPSRVFGDSPKPKASVLMDAVMAEWLREVKSYCSGLRGAPKAESLGERSPRKLSGSRPKKSNDSSSRRPRSLKRGRNEPVKKKERGKAFEAAPRQTNL